jgi:peptidoglycan/LPS O-acetylase OafA/YrhL
LRELAPQERSNRQVVDPRGPNRLDSLTSLRFLAALLVFANHAGDHLVAPGSSVNRVLQTGFVGVTFFFVLSGFVLTWASRSRSRRRFYRDRVARIVPNYLVAWSIALPVAVLTGLVLTRLGILASLGLVQAWHPSPDVHFAVNPVGWTLSVEAFFYLMFPFVVGPLGRLGRRARLVAMAGCVAATVGWAFAGYLVDADGRHWIAYVFPLARLPEFAFGILLAFAVRAGGWRRVRLGPALAVTAAAIALGLALPPAFRIAAVVIIPFALVIAAAAHADVAGEASPLLRTRTLVRLGVWSYAFYLLHELVLRGFTEWLGLDGLPPVAVAMAAAALLVVAVAASGLLATLVERPAQARLRGRHGTAAEVPDARGARSVRQ